MTIRTEIIREAVAGDLAMDQVNDLLASLGHGPAGIIEFMGFWLEGAVEEHNLHHPDDPPLPPPR